jgi:hypothetical protein
MGPLNDANVPHYSYAVGAREVSEGGGWQLQLVKAGEVTAHADFPAPEGPTEHEAFFAAMDAGENWLLAKALLHATPLTYRCLCQSCLRIPRFVTRPQIDIYDIPSWVQCECGGELCDCPSCMAVAELLEAGIRNRNQLGTAHSIADWTPTGGMVRPEGGSLCGHAWPEADGQTDINGSCEKCGLSFQRYIHGDSMNMVEDEASENVATTISDN